ncbi:glycoside hydrolase family 3 N-terminal domain-containing protein [Gemmatimonas sp.]|uniref:glycoside hydrolase family 3 N-terminal domain-containing protein n=1 Tax=Gemmatimonas sp. TaxID=1962908 RepID=UPI0033418B40
MSFFPLLRPLFIGSTAVAVGATALAPAMRALSAPPATAPYRDPACSPAARAQDLLGRMTLDEKFWQLFMIPGDRDDQAHDYRNGAFGLQINVPAAMRADAARSDSLPAAAVARAHAARINALQRYFVDSTRLGIPLLPFEETLHGLGREGATTFPQAIGLAASWDTTLMARVAGAIATEARSRGIRHSLSPVVNIANDVRWGRVEETYGEDVLLSSAMGRAYIRAFESRGIVSTPKHFVANVGDGGRDSYPIEFSERLLRERYLPPFKSAVLDAGARSIMSAYNSVDGQPASQNRHLLTDVLKREWRFNGFVISDAAATGGSIVLHHTEANTAAAAKHALESGLDVIFQSEYAQHRAWLNAFRTGGIDPAAIDSAVLRVLRVKFALGLFEHPYVNVDSAAQTSRSPAHVQLAREAASASFVLLRNVRNRLPLRGGAQRIAVIGADASEARVGGYSPPGARAVSIADGIAAGAPRGTAVRMHAGVPRLWRDLEVIPAAAFAHDSSAQSLAGLRGRYWDNATFSNEPTLVRRDALVNFQWTLSAPGRGIPFDWFSARWEGTLKIPAGGVRTIAVEGNDGYRLYVNDTLRIERWQKASFGTQRATLRAAPGSTVRLRLEYYEATGNARLRLLWDAGIRDTQAAQIASAAQLARTSDVAVVVAGIEEGEFRDRALLGLPGKQEALIRAVAATGTPVVVVLVGGSAITMPWIEQVDAVLDVWYPGQEGGHAVADMLFGRTAPAGRLPLTFPLHEGQVPLHYAHKPTGRGDDYLDLTGHPLFPFGHGLSYTTFTYDSLDVAVRPVTDSVALRVSFTVRNSGTRQSDEVAQLYLRDVLARVARPITELAAFARITLAPGATQRVSFDVKRAQLQFLDESLSLIEEPGTWRIMVGASSRDIRLRREVAVPSPTP